MIAPPGLPPRVAVLWCPDWPVVAAMAATRLDSDAAVALIERGLVFASSVSARANGVTRGLRLREAQARWPALHVLDYDPTLDSRAFEPVIAAMEDLVPGVQVLRPGMCAVPVRGAARYYGGENAAGLFFTTTAHAHGAPGARVGIADGVFTAVQAARRKTADPVPGAVPSAPQIVHVVPPGESATFLAPLPIALMDDDSVTLLRRLGITTLGQFARLPAPDVARRFGASGARLHALASGRDSWPVIPRTPPPNLGVVVNFEPALDRVDQVAFGVRSSATDFIEKMTATRLACTAIRIELDSDSGEQSHRVWLHPRSFTAVDVVDRVRWQLQGANVVDAGLGSGITAVHIIAETVDTLANYETGLWGSGPDERIHHGLSRVQSMLGHGAVLMPGVGGGRSLADRQQLVAWGDRAVGVRPVNRPWPGRVPTPLPGSVFTPRRPVQVHAGGGGSVAVDDRGMLSGEPQWLEMSGQMEMSGQIEVPTGVRASDTSRRSITAWAGPWPVDERWWSAEAHSQWRVQAVDETGCAWLLVLEHGTWWAEARYD